MDTTADIAKVKDLFVSAQQVLIVTHEHPTFDSMGSSLALYLGLTGMGKKVTIACPDQMTVGFSNFIGVNKVTQELGKKNFVISLDYVDGSIEKVSYHIEGDTFNLVIEPRPGFEPFSSDKVHYSYSGAAADVIIAVDTIHLGGLKKLYDADKELYASKSVINIDRHPNNAQYGQINIVNAHASSTAEVMAQVLSGVGIALTEDIATNLLNALYGGTNNFQHPAITAGAFELAASCLKAGGRRFAPAASAEELPQRGESTTATKAEPLPEEKPHERSDVTVSEAHPSTQAPADWLKPKIFKSSHLL